MSTRRPRNSTGNDVSTPTFDKPSGRIGLLFINFGEPDQPTLDKVEPYLERIFLQNTDLEGHAADAAVARAKQLASRRAPGLIEEYEEIGGSPLNAQADRQAERVTGELGDRGWDVRGYSAFQFTDPSILDRLTEARADGVERLVVLPVYPICGQSTTVAALEAVDRALDELDWSPAVSAVSGWHRHSTYEALRADHIAEFVVRNELDLADADTLLYFSVHGTPVKYLNDGNRYDRYVEEHTRALAERLGAERYAVGFQNHSNRGVVWTQPDNERLIPELTEGRLVVVPLAFMHEQSETLAELDGELREFTEELGKEFHRVPVPHDDDRFIVFLSDLVAELIADGDGELSACRCHPDSTTSCTNGTRELPPSPYAPAVGQD